VAEEGEEEEGEEEEEEEEVWRLCLSRFGSRSSPKG
jgi:hypothetical protein